MVKSFFLLLLVSNALIAQPNQLNLRRMTLADIQSAYTIETQVAASPWRKAFFKYCVIAGYENWIFVDQSKIIGYGIFKYADDRADILNLAIDPQYQGQGLGKQLLNHLIKQAQALHVNTITLKVRPTNQVAINLYKKFSFVETDILPKYYKKSFDTSEPEDAILMQFSW